MAPDRIPRTAGATAGVVSAARRSPPLLLIVLAAVVCVGLIVAGAIWFTARVTPTAEQSGRIY